MLHIFPFKPLGIESNFVPKYYYVLSNSLDDKIYYLVISLMNLIDTLCAVVNGHE